MRVFDSQKRVLWSSPKGEAVAPFKIRQGEAFSVNIECTKIYKLKIIGKKTSGDGSAGICVRADKEGVVFSQKFKFPNKSSFEVVFDCLIDGGGLQLTLDRPKGAVGGIIVERVLVEGEKATDRTIRRVNRSEKKVVDYRSLTGGLSRRSRLAIIIPYGIYGGGEVYIKNLVQNGHKYFYIDILFVANNRLIEELADCPVNVIKTGGLSGLSSRLNSDRYKSIVFYNSKAVYDILVEKKLLKKCSADIIEVYHSDFSWPDSISSLRSRSYVDKIFRVSDGLAEDIKGVSPENKVCIPVGVDHKRFGDKHAWPRDVSAEYGRTIGMVARLSPEKNIDYAMSVMKGIPDFQLVIVGTGPLRQRLEVRKEKEDIKNVTFVGYKRNVEEYYSAFDALLLTSKIEGTPISIIEALSGGLPVFTTPVGQIERNYSNLRGVSMLSGEVKDDAKLIESFNYSTFDGSHLRAFALSEHSLSHTRELFFSSMLNSSQILNTIEEGTCVIEGEYI